METRDKWVIINEFVPKLCPSKDMQQMLAVRWGEYKIPCDNSDAPRPGAFGGATAVSISASFDSVLAGDPSLRPSSLPPSDSGSFGRYYARLAPDMSLRLLFLVLSSAVGASSGQLKSGELSVVCSLDVEFGI